MKKTNNDAKPVFINVVKNGKRLPAIVRPEMTAEDILLVNDLAGGRLGTVKKGPYFQDLEKPYPRIRLGKTLFCLFHVQ